MYLADAWMDTVLLIDLARSLACSLGCCCWFQVHRRIFSAYTAWRIGGKTQNTASSHGFTRKQPPPQYSQQQMSAKKTVTNSREIEAALAEQIQGIKELRQRLALLKQAATSYEAISKENRRLYKDMQQRWRSASQSK
jgi:hypothetical protein